MSHTLTQPTTPKLTVFACFDALAPRVVILGVAGFPTLLKPIAAAGAATALAGLVGSTLATPGRYRGGGFLCQLRKKKESKMICVYTNSRH